MIARLAQLALWGLSLAAAALFVGLALMHLRYVAELDYIEGVMMDHVVRLAQGKAIYVEPTLSFIPLAYMPVYPALVSLLARAFGPQWWEGRLLSFGATLGIATLAVAMVRRETRSWTIAGAAGGIYLMGYGAAGGGHYDVIRPDSIMLFLALAGFATLRVSSGAWGTMAAALLLSLSFFTKQHALWFGFAALLHVVLNDRRRLVPFGLCWVIGCAGGYALLSAWLGPWFSYYTWDLPAHWSQLSRLRITHYLGAGLLGMLGPLTISSLLSLALPEPPWRGRSGLWMWLGIAGVGTGLLGTLDPNAWRHVFMPTMVSLAVLGPISLHRLVRQSSEAAPATAARGRVVACAVLLFQFVPLIYAIHILRPHPAAAAARAEFLDLLRKTPGRVIVLEHGFYAWTAGKQSGLHQIAIGDLERSHGDRLDAHGHEYLQHLEESLRHGPDRPTIITDEPLETVSPMWTGIAPGYRLARDLGQWTEPLRGFAGHALPPRFVYVPTDSTAPDTTGSKARAQP